ncbi:hypothetical protein N8D74_03715 [Curtobacterium flaccumfaciens]|uniref:Uncharacterized protein n=1 Tax=Curtobacterium poinsettiae TaxID=159612 RepID=A0A9Q9T3G7_9MICO|nr:hypothetical protein [Curtobacterium flaccumfaciens]UXN26000.1 hypothetical protein N8D74_03715 [Curtobacterium flaccumfaciens]UYC80842.1 hypothetical protein OE229_17300 [Curtobacterium flaccumfaciens pv. poinsettiae]
MTAAELGYLGVDPERASARVAFATAYAQLAGEDYAREATISEPQTGTSEGNRLEAATAYREAAQWSLALGTDDAFDRLATAARWFSQLGLPYGHFLGAACRTVNADGPLLREGDVIRQLRNAVAGSPVESDRFERRGLASRQQQAYLFVAAAATPELADEFRDELAAIADLPAMGLGTAPVGALGAPVQTYVRAGLALMDHDRASVLLRVLVGMSRRFEDAASLASSNRYLWRNASAPVDIPDLDIIALVALGVDRVEGFARRLREAASELSGWARFSINVAIEAIELRQGGRQA